MSGSTVTLHHAAATSNFAHQLLEVLAGLERADVQRDADLLELLAQDLAGLHQHRHLRLHEVGQGQAGADAGVGEELLGLREVGATLVGVDAGAPHARLGRGLGGDRVAAEVQSLTISLRSSAHAMARRTAGRRAAAAELA
jgi:hypothetical protein